MMQVEELSISKKKAEEEFQALKQAFKQNVKLKRDEIRQDLYQVSKFMRHGKKVIDIYESFKKAGLNEHSNPKLAICPADAKRCYLVRRSEGSALFSGRPIHYRHNRPRTSYGDIALPEDTFDFPKTEYGSLMGDDFLETTVPLIPAKILVQEVKVLLRNFHILWEVEEWKPIPPRDPILLRRLTPNLFGILATWDLTPLERAVIRGRL